MILCATAPSLSVLGWGPVLRLSLPVLAALCDIFQCSPADLIATRAENATPRKAAGTAVNVVDLTTPVRPKRARIRPEG